MSDDTSARLALPLLSAGQAQKEVTHNEALALLDLLVQPAVIAAGVNTPPGTPVPGQAWIVGSTPTGAWASHPGAIAGWTTGGWRFAAPVEGYEVWCAADGFTRRFTGGAWRTGTISAAGLEIAGKQVVGPQRPAIADPAGGTEIDDQARTTLGAILAALRDHGLIAA